MGLQEDYSNEGSLDMTHEVLEVKTVVETDVDGVEHEYIFGIVINYSSNGKYIESIDTKYWRHFAHCPKYGLQKEDEGTDVDTMYTDNVYNHFTNICEQLTQDHWESKQC